MKLNLAPSACRLCTIVLALASVTSGVCAQERVAADTPAGWLHAMDRAFRELDYDGVFTYSIASHSQIRLQDQRGDSGVTITADVAHEIDVATFRLVHKVIDGVEHERIAHLGGPRREILRTGGQVSYVQPSGDQSYALEAHLPMGPYPRRSLRSEDLAANYRFRIIGHTRVLGRPSVCLEIHPQDGNRYGYLLWLDEATGLLLRSELRDASGTHLERVEFKSLRLGDSVTADALKPELPGDLVQPATVSDEGRPAPTSEPVNWGIGWVPTGFSMTDAHPHDEPEKGVHIMFSDGLATFSVFVESARGSSANGVFSRSGATVLLSYLTGERGDYLVTVVGEVPPDTAQRIAESVYRDPM